MAQSLPTNRAIRDAQLTTNIAMPNANAVTLSAAFDLGQPNAFAVNEKFAVVVTIPATNIVSAKSTTFVLESADANVSANFAAVAGSPTVTITATYPGASAETLARTVAAPIEEQLSGIEGMLFSWPDFVPGIRDFGETVMPKLRAAASQLA